MDVSAIGVGERGVCAFPGCYAAAAAAEGEEGRLDPEGAEAVEEVCLAGYGAVVHVCVSQFSDVNLVIAISLSCEMDKWEETLRYLDNCKSHSSRIQYSHN